MKEKDDFILFIIIYEKDGGNYKFNQFTRAFGLKMKILA